MHEKKEGEGDKHLRESDYKASALGGTSSNLTTKFYQNNERLNSQNEQYKQHLKAYMQKQQFLNNERSSYLSGGSSSTTQGIVSSHYSHIFKERQTKRLFEKL